MEPVNLLKKTRTPHRTRTTKLLSQIEEALIDENIKIDDLEELLEQLVAKSNILKDLDCKILPLLKESEIESEVLSCSEYDEKIISCKTKLNRRIRSTKIDNDNIHASNKSCLEQAVPEIKTVKLPKLHIPKFYGETDKYLNFWSQFESAIHKNPHLSDTDKFSYLKSLVGGSAGNAINGFALSEKNYAEAIKILESRFGRKDMLIQAHLNNLLNINPVKNSDDLRGLRNLYDKCETETRSLQSLDVTTNTYDSLLCPIILKLLPPDLTLAFSRKQDKNGKWELQSLIDFLRCEIESRERALAFHKTDSRRPVSQTVTKLENYNSNKTKSSYKPTFHTKNYKSNVSTAAELLINQDDICCLFCRDTKHKTENCVSLSVNEKKEILKKEGRCFLCLKKFHRIIDCVEKPCSLCNKMHNITLCFKRENAAQKEISRESAKSTNTVSNHVFQERNKILLQTAMVELIGPKGQTRSVRCVFDGGAQRTYINTDVSKALRFPCVGRENLVIHTFQSSAPAQKECARVQVQIRNRFDDQVINIQALEIENITQAVLDSPDIAVCEKLERRGLMLADMSQITESDTNISLLIGADYYWHFVTGKIERLSEDLVAAESKLGWLLMGQTIGNINENRTSCANIVTSMLVHSSNIENLWKLDLLGIQDPTETKCRKEMEVEALNYFKQTVAFEEGRYEVHLPWVAEKDNLSQNFDIAKQRLINNTRRLVQKGKFDDYGNVFEEWLKDGVIEEVPHEEINNQCHYLPHRGVFKENSTTKLRPVFDASCRDNNSPSLNHCLEKGPNLLEEILPILMRFRKHKIGVISDIKKAFLQISVTKPDREYLRFLWWKNYETKELKILRHKRVVFGLNCSPFLLAAVLNHHIELNSPKFPETAEILKESFYVDNSVTSVPNESTLYRFIEESRQMLASASFDLRGWEYTSSLKTENFVNPTPVLGILWNKQDDTLFCDIQANFDRNMNLTRRNILSAVHRIFDPVGLLCPITLIPKLLIQKTWAMKIGWDEKLPEDFGKEFVSWIDDLSLLSNITIPRCLDVNEDVAFSLHIFCDASKHAYGSVVYLRKKTNQDIVVHFVLAKSRVSPLRKITIPRLELLSCCIGVRLASVVLHALKLENIAINFWTDSSTALSWIQRDDNWAPFVANRVNEIRQLSSKSEWRHIPGNCNPADLPSRGCSIKSFVKSDWWKGPEWLWKNEEDWPTGEAALNEEEILQEKRKSIISTLTNIVTNEEQWYLKYFSNYMKIVRMTAWILRFVTNCRTPERKLDKTLSVEEIDNAEKTLLKIVQRESFSKEEKLKNHFTFIDDEGIIRLKTKILRRNDDENFRCPILLPSKHELVERMILHYHLQFHHAGTQVVLTNIRHRFWIVRGRKTVQRVIFKCIRCKRHSAKPIDSVPCPLPEDRVRDAYAFEVTGVDVAGPLNLRGNRKAWILLFTCGVYRAVHLELIESLSTNGFFLGFRRFIARRGRPRTIYSDNGTNFVGAKNLLRSIDWNQIVDNSSTMKIQWKLNPPTAAWWGGWWERLVQMVKKLLRRVLGKALLLYEEMATILCDAEATINSRPLTYLSEDPSDLAVLTPSMFIQDVRSEGVPDLDNLDKINISKRWKYHQRLRAEFRKRFRDEYLGMMVHRPKNVISQSINEGDVVLIEDHKKKRSDWPIGRVITVYPGKDNNIRVVKVKTANGELVRPVKRVYPLELDLANLKDSPTEHDYRTRYGRKTVKPYKHF